MIVSEKEREIARELLRGKFSIDDFHESVQDFVTNKLEEYVYNNYAHNKRNKSYIQYITELYLHNKGIRKIREKYLQLLCDLKRTQTKLYEKKNITIKEGTRAWAAVHLPPPTTTEILELHDEIGVAKPIWDSEYGINIKVSYMQKLI